MNVKNINYKIFTTISACACAFIIALLSLGKVDAYAASQIYHDADNGLNYTWNGSGTMTITGGSGYAGVVNDTYKIKFMEYWAIDVQNELQTLELKSSGIKEIGNNAFSDCPNLSVVNIYDHGITRFGDYCFANCPKMTFKCKASPDKNATFKRTDYKFTDADKRKQFRSLREIGKYAFYNCSSFTGFSYHNTYTSGSNQCHRSYYTNFREVTHIGEHAFDGSALTSFCYVVYYDNRHDTSESWQESAPAGTGENGGAINSAVIDDYAFANCPRLNHCVINNNCTFNNKYTVFAGSHNHTDKILHFDKLDHNSYIKENCTRIYNGSSTTSMGKGERTSSTKINLIDGAVIDGENADIRIELTGTCNLNCTTTQFGFYDGKQAFVKLHFYPAGTLMNHLTDDVSTLKKYEIGFNGLFSARDLDYHEGYIIKASQVRNVVLSRDTYVQRITSCSDTKNSYKSNIADSNYVCWASKVDNKDSVSGTHGRAGSQYKDMYRVAMEVDSTPDNPLTIKYYNLVEHTSRIGLNISAEDTDLYSKVIYHIQNPQESWMTGYEKTEERMLRNSAYETQVVESTNDYVFDGWYFDSGLNNRAPGSFTLEEAEYNLYGKFTIAHSACTSTLNIYPNNGKWTGGSEDEMLSNKGTYYIETRHYYDDEPVPTMYIDNTKITREGFIFDGWDYDGTSGCWANNKFTFKDKAVGNLHARWKRTTDTATAGRGGKGVSVTVNNGRTTVFGLQGANGTDVNAVVSSDLLARIPASMRKGSTGGGQNVKLAGAITYMKDGKIASISKIKDYNKPLLTGNPDITMSPVSAIRFDLNGVTGTIPGAVEECYYVFDTDDVTATVTPDVESSELNAKKIDGFLGWGTSYNGQVVFAKDTPITASDIKTILDWNDSSKPRTISLYAIWKYKNITNIHVTEP